jgi:hypothetical protein
LDIDSTSGLSGFPDASALRDLVIDALLRRIL